MPRKFLFANVPLDGHFNPLTDLAVHLKEQGHDVRWYAGKSFAKKLERFGIPHFPFEVAKEITQFNIDEFYPERAKLKAGVPKLKFDLKYFFVHRGPEYYEDISKIHKEFAFDTLICDSAFTGAQLVKEKLNVHAVCLGIFPLMQTSKDCAPYGLGVPPDNSFMGRFKQSVMRAVAKNLLFKESTKEYNKILANLGISPIDKMLFDIPIEKASLYLQSGIPSFEYQRSDLAPTVKFVGGLRTFKDPAKAPANPEWMKRLDGSKKVILVSQGTFESDHSKLLNPTLEIFKGSEYLVLVATGYHHTEALRKKYPHDNIIIEDFMDFDAVMPKCDVYITNGGYGGVLLSIDHALPMVCAGIDEGKNEICTRVDYFKIGVDLKTERASSAALKAAVEKVIAVSSYKKNIERMKGEFSKYNTRQLTEKYILELK